MGLWNWSTTAANNATADPSINWQEGQAPSTVNDSARAMMAAIAVQFQTGWEWQMWGDTPTYVSGTQFTVPGNLTSRYTVGRRVRASVTAGTVYGTITASAFTSLTTVTVALDSGSLDSGLSEVDVSILNPANPSLPLGLNPTFATVTTTGNATVGGALAVTGNETVGGNLTVTGTVSGSNITGTSDERLKEDWRPMARDFLERMASVLHGTFAWKENGMRSAGAGAQSLREVFPEAVHEADDGTLSIAYGHAALVTVLELIPLVLRLLDAHGETP